MIGRALSKSGLWHAGRRPQHAVTMSPTHPISTTRFGKLRQSGFTRSSRAFADRKSRRVLDGRILVHASGPSPSRQGVELKSECESGRRSPTAQDRLVRGPAQRLTIRANISPSRSCSGGRSIVSGVGRAALVPTSIRSTRCPLLGSSHDAQALRHLGQLHGLGRRQ